MTNHEMRRSIEAHDTVVGLLAPLTERLASLVNLAELQNQRMTRLEDRKSRAKGVSGPLPSTYPR